MEISAIDPAYITTQKFIEILVFRRRNCGDIWHLIPPTDHNTEGILIWLIETVKGLMAHLSFKRVRSPS